MGDLLLCNSDISQLPYFLDEASLYIYSIEELCYYIENNYFLMDAGFMREELCTWIGNEAGLSELSKKLTEQIRNHASLSDFIYLILAEGGYTAPDKVKKIYEELKELDSKSPFECTKLRGDRYLNNNRYVSAVYEYRRLCDDPEENPVLKGNVWHNMGVAYSKMLLFDQAGECFRKAFELNSNTESLKEYLLTFRCRGDEAGYREQAAYYNVSEESRNNLATYLSELSRSEEIKNFELEMDDAFYAGNTTKISETLENWKNNYRKNCRI